MRQCNHSDVRLFSDAPVVDVDTGCEGQSVRILCRRNLADVILGMKLLTRSSLPQNNTALQPTAVVPQPTSHLQKRTTV